jgi:hypothetical protein
MHDGLLSLAQRSGQEGGGDVGPFERKTRCGAPNERSHGGAGYLELLECILDNVGGDGAPITLRRLELPSAWGELIVVEAAQGKPQIDAHKGGASALASFHKPVANMGNILLLECR